MAGVAGVTLISTCPRKRGHGTRRGCLAGNCWGDVVPQVWAWRPALAAMHIRPLRGRKIDSRFRGNDRERIGRKMDSLSRLFASCPACAGMTEENGNDSGRREWRVKFRVG